MKIRGYDIDYFLDLSKKYQLVDIVPSKITPTWKNSKQGGEGVCKRLNHFIMREYLVEYFLRYRPWVFHTNLSKHFPIALQIDVNCIDSNRPFKFDHSWLTNYNFCQMIRDFWLSVTCPENLNVTELLVFKLKLLKKSSFLDKKKIYRR